VATLYNTIIRGHFRWKIAAPIAALTVVCALTAGCGAGGQQRPNVLLVVISNLRADHISAAGYRRATTPNIDAIAAKGTFYETAVSPAPWTLAAHASILTGLFPAEHAVVYEHPVLEESLDTLPETLQAAGYATVAVSTESAIGQANGFGQGFETFTELHPEQEGSPDDGAARAESALTDWLGERKGTFRDKPFFAYVVLSNPALPFSPPGEYRQQFLDKALPLPHLDRLTQLWIPWARQYSLGLVTPSAEEMGALVSLYDGEIGYADYRLGRIVAALDDMGLGDDTLVVVTSDHGEDLGDHGMLSDTANLYDSVVRVPLVMSLPGRIAEGRRVTDQVETVDLMGAIVALTAKDAPAALPTAGPITPRQAAFMEARYDPAAIRYYASVMPGADVSIYERHLAGVRTSEFKYILTSRNTETLFDLQADPGENSPAVNSHPEEAERLRARIGTWVASLRKPPVPIADPEPAGAGGP